VKYKNKKFHYKNVGMMHLLKKNIKKVSIIMYELTMQEKSYKKRENEGGQGKQGKT